MKVLWFTNTPSLAAAHFNLPVIGGGWIESLEARIVQNAAIKLAIAFRQGDEKLQKIDGERTTYYAIPQKRKSKVREFMDRHYSVMNDEEMVKYCLEVIEDFNPDIINIFGTEDSFGLICKRTQIPVVIHLQGILTVYEKKWFASQISKWDLVKNSGIKSLIKANSLLHEYWRFRKASHREQKIFSGCKYFMGRTDWDRRMSSVLSPDSKYFYCSEALRAGFYTEQWNKNAAKEKIFVSTIQSNIYKGLETILECAVLLKTINKFDFKWYVAGIAADDIIVRIFERKIRKKFEDYNIILSGRLGIRELMDIELGADIFIHPSHIDNSPNSVCEAMLLGMPVIATFTGGTGSLLEDKKEGLLIQDGDPYAMAGAILDLVNDHAYASKLGRNARSRAMSRHNADTINLDLTSIYSTILKGTLTEKTKG